MSVTSHIPVGRHRSGRLATSQTMPIVILLVLVGAVAFVNPAFLGARSLEALIDEASPLMILATGETLVILTGRIDLSVAVLATLATVLLAIGLPIIGWFAVPLTLACTALAGASQGYIHVKAQIPSFVVSLAAMAVWSGIALGVSGAQSISIFQGYDAIGWANQDVAGVSFAFLVAVTLCLLVAAAMRWLPIGRWIVAIGFSEAAARLSGVRVDSVVVFVFGISGFCAGLTGVVFAAQYFSGSPSLANTLLLPTVAAVVIGGTAITGGSGGVTQTMFGALTITVLGVGFGVMGLDTYYEPVAYGLVLIAAIAVTMDRSKLTVVK